MRTEIPKGHPRYESLMQREALVKGYEQGITALAGLIAHGRGEAFDYLLGEKTIPPAKEAVAVAAVLLMSAENPVISVNGNTAMLCPDGLVKLASECGAKLEVNLFYRTDERVRRIEEVLLENGAQRVYGIEPKAQIKGTSSKRGKVDAEGIYTADVVLVPLEDGDRTEALVAMGKKVIAIDLNPLSRTTQNATVSIVDNVVRAVPELISEVKRLKSKGEAIKPLRFDNKRNLEACLERIKKGL